MLNEGGIENLWMSVHTTADKSRAARLMRDHVMPLFA